MCILTEIFDLKNRISEKKILSLFTKALILYSKKELTFYIQF